MKRDRMRELAQNPNLIEGIYNYCDRWCERCAYTDRCLNYAISSEQFVDLEDVDVEDESFWDQMGQMLADSKEMVEEDLTEPGIELDEADLEAAGAEIAAMDAQAEEDPCVQRAAEYADLSRRWFREAIGALRAKQEELKQEAELDLPGGDPHGEADLLNDALEVVQWYQHLIQAKVHRAVRGALDEGDEEMVAIAAHDRDGSAKVALLGIDRSIEAWRVLHDHLGDESGAIVDMLVLLDRLRKATETAFPGARAFVRPGLDAPAAGG